MVYTQSLYPNDAAHFPAPPQYLVWRRQHSVYNYDTRRHEDLAEVRGQVRHVESLQKAKKNVSYSDKYHPDGFWCDWAIYKLDDQGQYQLIYSGKKGEKKKDNALFRMQVPKENTKGHPTLEPTEDEIAEALGIVNVAS